MGFKPPVLRSSELNTAAKAVLGFALDSRAYSNFIEDVPRRESRAKYSGCHAELLRKEERSIPRYCPNPHCTDLFYRKPSALFLLQAVLGCFAAPPQQAKTAPAGDPGSA